MDEAIDRQSWTQTRLATHTLPSHSPLRDTAPAVPVIARLRPLCELNRWQLSQLLLSARQQDLACREELSGWALRNWYVYLLHGDIVLRGKRQRADRVRANTPRATAPLIDKPGLTLVASCTSRLLKVDRMRFDQLRDARAMIEVRENSPAESERLIQQMFGGC